MIAAAQRVYVVTSDDRSRTELRRILVDAGFETICLESMSALLERESRGPACVVLDHRGVIGAALRKAIAGDGALAVVFVTDTCDVPAVVEAMKSGAVDFLSKPVDTDQLVAAVNRGLERSATGHAEFRLRDTFLTRVARLTPREHQVALGVIQGLLNKQIAWELGTTVKTVKVHRARAMEKLEVTSVAELARMAERTRALSATTSLHAPALNRIVVRDTFHSSVKNPSPPSAPESRRIYSREVRRWRSTC